MHQAKTNLSRLVSDLRSGTESEIVIAVGKEPAARLLPLASREDRPLGLDTGLFEVPDDFDAPSSEIEALFEGARQP